MPNCQFQQKTVNLCYNLCYNDLQGFGVLPGKPDRRQEETGVERKSTMSLAPVKSKHPWGYILIISYLLSVLTALVVFWTGGTNKVYANLMYIPIAIMASSYGKRQGVIHAVISALLIGPFMPLDTVLQIEQQAINWLIRLVIYAVIALIIGFFSDYYRFEYEQRVDREKKIAEAQMAMVYSLVKLAESRDDNIGGHIERVSKICQTVAGNLRRLKKYRYYIDDNYIEKIGQLSPLHDIGKVGIPDYILRKPGRLSPEEYELMKKHTLIGARTLREVKEKFPEHRFLELAICITKFHHEKWDGTGYPLGLAGSDIPLSARIMAIADVYDALRSKRVYKDAVSHEESIRIILEGSGTFFDPEVVNAFMESEDEIRTLFDRYNDGEWVLSN